MSICHILFLQAILRYRLYLFHALLWVFNRLFIVFYCMIINSSRCKELFWPSVPLERNQKRNRDQSRLGRNIELFESCMTIYKLEIVTQGYFIRHTSFLVKFACKVHYWEDKLPDPCIVLLPFSKKWSLHSSMFPVSTPFSLMASTSKPLSKTPHFLFKF